MSRSPMRALLSAATAGSGRRAREITKGAPSIPGFQRDRVYPPLTG